MSVPALQLCADGLVVVAVSCEHLSTMVRFTVIRVGLKTPCPFPVSRTQTGNAVTYLIEPSAKWDAVVATLAWFSMWFMRNAW